MNDKRLQLFGMYSMSILIIIAIFSFTIYFNVNLNEKRRVEDYMISTSDGVIKKINESQLGTEKGDKNVNDYIIENNITAILWTNDREISIEKNPGNFENISHPRILQTLENQFVTENKVVYENGKIAVRERVISIYSYARPVTTKSILGEQEYVLQILYESQATLDMLNNLTNILIIGTLVVSILGIAMGIMMSYLNMIPVVSAWMQQRTFVADASHELRTPLSIITLKSDGLLKHSEDSIYEHIEDVAVIQQECRRMHKMVDNLLFLAKKDSGVVDMEVREFRVQQLLDDLELLYQEFFEIADKELIIENTYKEHAMGDYEKLKQVFMIIIDNALRFTSEGEYVKIKTDVRAGRVNFSISNNGEPIDPKEIPFIFERFYKGDKTRAKTDGSGGNGLGLSIAQEIIMLHQSKIRVSINDGVTTFSFSLQKK